MRIIRQNTKAVQPQTQVQVGQKVSYIYTANEGGSLSRINASTNKLIDTIKIDGSAHNVQVSPDGKIIGATIAASMEGKSSHGSMNINDLAAFYDAQTGKLINQVEVGEHPAHIVFTNDGKYALVTNNGSNSVSVIDITTFKVKGTIPTGKGPHGFRISKNNKYAYIANMGQDTVSVLDIANMKETKKIKVGKTPVTTAISNDGKTLLVTINAGDSLAVVDVESGNVQKIPVGDGPAQVYLQGNDKFAFVANQGTEEKPSNTVSKIDLSTKKVVATIETGKGSHGVVISSDDKHVYVTNMFENTVSVIDNDQNKVIATVNVDKTPNGITFVK
ncbi:cytochrome D1 domain-containing protein [Desulfitobacterium hafniense]|uniref:YNCE-like beta-propeller domain-containing protein n=1 Tax=Desulfitobacterium hafniense (strain Y51) TaxID=138119 RepID=Q24NS3_DESHY|nr:YncE family protein [Desulfitobacterium hafniense]BAE86319.1 hypothetical protein DSY4530 [Desulfitobacterium hafniense Y51]